MPDTSHLTQAIMAQDSPSVDAFGRWRVSTPETLFDSKNLFRDLDADLNAENQPLFYDNQQVSGSGTYTRYNPNQSSQTMGVSSGIAGKRVRQTKMRFNYQPGKSQLVLMTFNLHGQNDGVTKEEGIFDDNNGLFLRLDGTDAYFVTRSKASGSVVDIAVKQSKWNLDKMDGNGPSDVELDFTHTQIMIIDYEWLGVGRVRMGFVVDGKVYYAHQFLNANNLEVVYMSTPNLPLRSSITALDSNNGGEITQICSTVASEGGVQDAGTIRYASTQGTHLDANTENSVYMLMAIQLKENYIGETVHLLNAAVQLQTGSHKVEWTVLFNPTIDGAVSFVGQTNSAIQVALGATANTVSALGTPLAGGFAESGGVQGGNSGSDSRSLLNALLLGSNIDGTRDIIALCVRPVGGSTNVDVEGSLAWREGT